jgi:hypothetical protein
MKIYKVVLKTKYVTHWNWHAFALNLEEVSVLGETTPWLYIVFHKNAWQISRLSPYEALHIRHIIITKYAEKNSLSVLDNGYHVLFSWKWLMYTKYFEMYNHRIFVIHIYSEQVLLTLKVVYALIVLVL